LVEWMLGVSERKKTRRREKGGEITSFVLPPVSAVVADRARSRCWRFARKERQKAKPKGLGRRAKKLLVKVSKTRRRRTAPLARRLRDPSGRDRLSRRNARKRRRQDRAKLVVTVG